MKNNKEITSIDFDKAFLFKGSDIVYPIISIFCLFFYVSFFGQGMEYQKLNSETPNWPFWFLLSCVSFLLLNVWGYQKNLVSKRLIVINTFVYSLSFFMIEYELFHLLLPSLCAEVVVFVYCVLRTFKRPVNIKRNWLWLTPIVYIMLYYIYPTIIEIVTSSVVFLSFLTFHDAYGKRSVRYILCCVAILIYLFTTLIYCPFNPFLLNKNIESVNISLSPRGSSLIAEEGGKYVFIDGWSLTGKKLVNTQFDTVVSINPYIDKFGGLRIANAQNFEFLKSSPDNQDINNLLFPISAHNNIIYFSCQKSIYDVLNNSISSGEITDSLTARLYYDYINLCDKNDSINNSVALKDGKELNSYILESLDINHIKRECQSDVNGVLRYISRNLSLGMLNALSMDLLLCGDYTTAIKVFSYQFFFTFYDTDIYKQININFTNKTSYGSEQTIKESRVASSDLMQLDSFEYWTQMFSMSANLAAAFILENYKLWQSEVKEQLKQQSNVLGNGLSFNSFNVDNVIQLREQIDELFNKLYNYGNTPNLISYITAIRQYFYSCVKADVYPDYNSYFLNRFNDVSPILPLDSLSQTAYNDFKKLYISRFEKDVKAVLKSKSEIDSIHTQIDSLLQRQIIIHQFLQSLNIDDYKKKEARINRTSKR